MQNHFMCRTCTALESVDFDLPFVSIPVCVCAVSTIPNEYLSTRRSLFHVEFKPTEWEIHFIGFVVHSCVHVLTHYCRDAEFELNKNR